VAVAGLGAIGLLHARHLAQQLCGARLAYVVDQDRVLAEAAGGELGVPSSTALEAALDDPAVAAVVIATPSPLHAEMVEQAARANKHVFCEKPLSLDVVSGERATAAAGAAGVSLQVGFQRRFDPDFVEARHRVSKGELGDVLLLRISHRNRVPPHEGPLGGRLGSPFVDMTIHDFDTALWLVGPVSEVSAFASTDSTLAALRFESGALGVIDNTRRAGYGFECAAELVGTRSTLRVGHGARASGVEQLTRSGALTQLPADHVERHRAAYLEEMRHFVACVRVGARPAVGGAEATAALALSLAAERCVA
jgi:myo-inositol 2-dehydrogenase / D-chiro-inositol 1-dehydrogenase